MQLDAENPWQLIVGMKRKCRRVWTDTLTRTQYEEGSCCCRCWYLNEWLFEVWPRWANDTSRCQSFASIIYMWLSFETSKNCNTIAQLTQRRSIIRKKRHHRLAFTNQLHCHPKQKPCISLAPPHPWGTWFWNLDKTSLHQLQHCAAPRQTCLWPVADSHARTKYVMHASTRKRANLPNRRCSSPCCHRWPESDGQQQLFCTAISFFRGRSRDVCLADRHGPCRVRRNSCNE